ncbi:MAG: MATE family efflux transporter [Oscillospiraceae bacterium]|nr:MATE family efflux transporter [Oscillospiraceae bacterium]
MNLDLTVGPPAKLLWKFSMPLLLSVVFQQLYNIVDSVVAGQFAGSNALAAVGASYPVTMLFMAVATGCNIGCSVIISQLFGARRYGPMKTAVSTSLIAVLGLGGVLTVAGLLFSPTVLRMLQTKEEIFADSAVYLNIYILGLAFLFLYNICNGVFTALGDSRTPLYFLIASSLANIAADVLFVTVFHMGVAGVAWATFLCQGAASVLSFIALRRRLAGMSCGKAKLFSGRMLGKISVVAIPSILQQSFISVGNLFIQALVNGYGADVIAGYSAAVKLNTFAITCFQTTGSALSSFAAQNIGAAKFDRVKQGTRSTLLLSVLIVLPFFILFFFFGRMMMGVFVNLNETPAEVIETGMAFLRIVSPFYFVIVVKLLLDGVLRGGGAMAAFMAATFTDLIVRVALAYIMAPAMGTDGIWLSWPIGWVIAAGLSLVFYLGGGWKKHVPKKHTEAQEHG